MTMIKAFNPLGINTAMLNRVFDSVAGGTVSSIYARQPGGQGMRIAGGSLTWFVPTLDEYIIEHDFYYGDTPFAVNTIFDFLDGATAQVDVRVATDGGLTITRGGTVIGTSTNKLQWGARRWIGVRVKIHNTTGTIELRVDNIPWITGTGLNTRSTSLNQITAVRFARNQPVWISDVVLMNALGTFNNGFIGDVTLTPLPLTGAGALTNFTRGGTDSGTNWGQVDEAIANDDTDYNQSATLNARDSFDVGDCNVDGNFYGVVLMAQARKDDAGARNLGLLLASGGSDSTPVSQPLATNYVVLSEIVEKDPNGAAVWTKARINAAGMQPGYKITL